MNIPPKVLGLVSSCGECPNCDYNSGGASQCRLIGERIRDKTIVAPFCPLPDYPSRSIAEMEITIVGLRKQFALGFGLTLMTHIATKLKLNMHTNGSGLRIPFRDMGKDREAFLELSCICHIGIQPFAVTFLDGNKKFKLLPDTKPSLLYEATEREGESWRCHELAL